MPGCCWVRCARRTPARAPHLWPVVEGRAVVCCVGWLPQAGGVLFGRRATLPFYFWALMNPHGREAVGLLPRHCGGCGWTFDPFVGGAGDACQEPGRWVEEDLLVLLILGLIPKAGGRLCYSPSWVMPTYLVAFPVVLIPARLPSWPILCIFFIYRQKAHLFTPFIIPPQHHCGQAVFAGCVCPYEPHLPHLLLL